MTFWKPFFYELLVIIEQTVYAIVDTIIIPDIESVMGVQLLPVSLSQ